mgnify:CR=1 FL=1
MGFFWESYLAPLLESPLKIIFATLEITTDFLGHRGCVLVVLENVKHRSVNTQLFCSNLSQKPARKFKHASDDAFQRAGHAWRGLAHQHHDALPSRAPPRPPHPTPPPQQHRQRFQQPRSCSCAPKQEPGHSSGGSGGWLRDRASLLLGVQRVQGVPVTVCVTVCVCVCVCREEEECAH